MSDARERSLGAVVLAAGQGTRMKSGLVKVLHPLAGRPMIRHVIDAVQQLGADRIVCVVGFQRDRVEDALSSERRISFAVQDEQLGTGHALQCASPSLEGFAGDLLVCCGDTPLLSAATLRHVVEVHRDARAAATLLTADLADPSGYGRVITAEPGSVLRIVEESDADAATRGIQTINTGVYCFHWPTVEPLLDRLSPENAQGERYLTDIMEILAAEGRAGVACSLDDPIELLGINDRRQLALAESILRRRIRDRLMLAGVTFLAPDTTLVDADVEIGPDSLVYPGVVIEGASSVGRESVIGPFCRIVDSHLGWGVELRGWNSIERTTIPNGSIIGPYVRQGVEEP